MNHVTEDATFGPVFANGVAPGNTMTVAEGVVGFCLMRPDTVLTVEMTVEAAAKLANRLHNILAKEAPDLLTKDENR